MVFSKFFEFRREVNLLRVRIRFCAIIILYTRKVLKMPFRVQYKTPKFVSCIECVDMFIDINVKYRTSKFACVIECADIFIDILIVYINVYALS